MSRKEICIYHLTLRKISYFVCQILFDKYSNLKLLSIPTSDVSVYISPCSSSYVMLILATVYISPPNLSSVGPYLIESSSLPGEWQLTKLTNQLSVAKRDHIFCTRILKHEKAHSIFETKIKLKHDTSSHYVSHDKHVGARPRSLTVWIRKRFLSIDIG